MIQCEKCSAPIDPGAVNTRTFSPCPHCRAMIRTDVFPAAVRPEKQKDRDQTLVVADDAGCYYHPSKKAVVACATCGRFLCSLCDIDMDGTHICFPCMASEKEKNQLVQLETHRVLYDSLALRVSILPLISLVFTWATCITAPVAIYFTFKHWKSKGSVVPRGRRWRAVTALVLSCAQVVAWAGLIVRVAHGPFI